MFDSTERTDSSPGKHQESTFAFLQRIAGDYWEHPRVLMQGWLDHVDNDDDYLDIRNRLRSRDDEQFRSASLELYLHEVLLRAGYELDIHPEVDGSSARPDFLARHGGESLYVEAIAPGANPSSKAAASMRAVLYDVINQVSDRRFYLWVEDLATGPKPPAAKRLRDSLTQWLAGLDPEPNLDLDSAPAYEWSDNGWSARVRAIPAGRGRHQRGASARAIGVYGGTRAEVVDDAPAIRKALTSKHRKYGDLGAPYMVALGTHNFDSDRWHATNALYGTESYQFAEEADDEVVAEPFRQPDGYFGAPPRWQNHRVSGVLIVNQLMPFHVQRAEVSLWRHPDPQHALPVDLGIPATVLALDGHHLDEHPPATTARRFFGLPDPWPPGQAWPKHDS